MNLRTFITEKRAVSPVIGVILMVAITVILAAVVGTFVLGLGDSLRDTSPSASYDWDQRGSGSLTLTHTSGQSIDADRVRGTVNGATITFGDDSLGEKWAGDDGRITAGDSVDWAEGDWNSGNGFEGGEQLRVIWTASGGGSSSTLTTYTVR
ncbi:type IV pilin [Halorubrum vacuolatum]|uniref:Flagellin N-terminal-like domain-containing protein n=1 Tax=Halorubrum vacuolatum TaxID=63740 RepID=A0A238UPK6_HALVU|nr:type IV pilin N-terminal domain-containing protein [Halorubrum vacuolatum]SNR23443.1 flagellin N-terminal-like domain-containing protein [Halorubrum vacuolatum]